MGPVRRKFREEGKGRGGRGGRAKEGPKHSNKKTPVYQLATFEATREASLGTERQVLGSLALIIFDHPANEGREERGGGRYQISSADSVPAAKERPDSF